MACSRDARGWFWLSVVPPLAAAVLFYFHRPWWFVALFLVITPLADAAIGRELPGLSEGRPRRTDICIPLSVVCGWACAIVVGADRAVSADITELIGLVIAGGVLSAAIMAHVHEIMHASSRVSRMCANMVFCLAGYPHYRIAHQLHHANVGDVRYGSTAALGVSVWRHAYKSFVASIRCSMAYESGRERVGNRVIQGLGAWGVLALVAFRFGSWRELCFFVGYGLVNVFVVEAVGYLQHYGLRLEDIRVGSQSAWNVDFWLSNRLFLNNGYHALHHEKQTLSYSELSAIGACLPGGYIHMLWLSLIPPLWFSTMDARARTVSRG